MPIRIANNLPARHVLEQERIFVMEEDRALTQDIRALKLVILNLMPNKIVTETQLLRALSNSPIQIDVELICTASHTSTHTSQEHLTKFYRTFDDIKDQYFDGMIITGAPVEKLPFEEVDYWPELERIMEWSKTHVYSTLHICWAAFAGLYYHYGIPKYVLDKKVFGVFEHSMTYVRPVKLFRGFDDLFYVPHSRYTEVRRSDVEKRNDLRILSESDECGIYAVSDLHGRQIFITGHSEYDKETLDLEYKRDRAAGLDTDIPVNYYRDNDPAKEPILKWRSSATLMYTNWLNYYVYQETPFDINDIKSINNEKLIPNRDEETHG
ncbi:MAG: homoserine O-succinyltransferase [Clostridiales bacterium]|nr:homoserine O-succinyltransferase [Clostridiales bacterium]MBR5358166.1 homoserine O-succinyltransferase [Clostridiales bacterium]